MAVAALTILAAFVQAGRPDVNLKPWGSFEGWSATVWAAVVWAGLPDPRTACEEFAKQADTDTVALGTLLEAWPQVDPNGDGLKASKVLKLLKDKPDDPEFREALAELCSGKPGELPSSQSLGCKLRQFSRRNVGGRCFDNRPGHGGIAVWFVRDARPSGGDGCDGCDVADHVASSHVRASNSQSENGELFRTNGRNMPTKPTIPTTDTIGGDGDSDGYSDSYEPTGDALTIPPPAPDVAIFSRDDGVYGGDRL